MSRICSLLTALTFAALCPAQDERPLSRLAFGSCAHQDRPQPIWDAVAAAKPELFVFLGDTIYADTADPVKIRAKYQKLGAVPGYQKLRELCPVLAVWDDHDFGLNDAGADFKGKDASRKEFLDFFGEPADSPRRNRPGLYTSRTYGPVGKRVQIILLDTRYFRSRLKLDDALTKPKIVPNTDADATVLGEQQWAWLGEQLRKPAEVRVLASSIQVVADDHPYEKWANFPAEREKLLNLLRDTRANGVVVISGDRHLAELSVDPNGPGYPLYDLTSSGLNQGHKDPRPLEVNRMRAATMAWGDNFGVVEVDWERPGGPLVRLQIRDVEGDVTIQQKVPLKLLQPAGAAPAVADAAVPLAAPVPSAAPAGVVAAAQARDHVGQTCTVELVVRSTGGNAERRTYINSEADFRDKNNFTLVVRREVYAALRDKLGGRPEQALTGKTVRVTGKVSLFQERPQIEAESADAVEVPK